MEEPELSPRVVLMADGAELVELRNRLLDNSVGTTIEEPGELTLGVDEYVTESDSDLAADPSGWLDPVGLVTALVEIL